MQKIFHNFSFNSQFILNNEKKKEQQIMTHSLAKENELTDIHLHVSSHSLPNSIQFNSMNYYVIDKD